LVAHLEARLDDVLKALDFLAEGHSRAGATRAAALDFVQAWSEQRLAAA
jgi:hypothetical protein